MKFFKKIPNFQNYIIFRNGIVYNTVNGVSPVLILHKKTNSLRVILYNKGVRKNITVKKLVAELFLPGPKKKNILHKDNNPKNIHYTNLYYTNKQRIHDNTGRCGIRGEDRSKKLKNKDVAFILISSYSTSRLAKIFDMTHVNIVLIRQGKRWQHIYDLPQAAKEALAKGVELQKADEFKQLEVKRNVFSKKGVQKILKQQGLERKKVPVRIDRKTTIYVFPEKVEKTKLKYNLL